MKNSEINYVKVEVQYPLGNTGYNKEMDTVSPLNKDTVTTLIRTEITCANYRLGQVMNGKFYVFYVGRVTGEPLHQRLMEHFDEYRNYKHVFFQFIEQGTEEEAYRQECRDFHAFQDIDEEESHKYFMNKIHPARPHDSSLTCDICGK